MSAQIMLLPSNPRANYLAHKKEIDDAIERVLNSGQYILGPEVKEFENEFARYVGVRLGVGVSSGTDALHLALRACGIKEGDEVITVSHTAVGTVAAIELCGATPVLIDINPSSYTIDPKLIKQAVTQRTKAIIPVHLYGHPAEMTSVLDAASQHKLLVIEDCAQSHGATYKGRKTGAWGDIAAFSFYPTKNLGAIGDGGIVVTNKPAFAERVRLLREYGWEQRYISNLSGLNSRLDELQAAILRIKLRHIDEENKRRQNLAKVYDETLSGTDLILPTCSPEASHVYHQYVVRSRRRDSLREFLLERNIGTLIHYPVPIHLQPAYQGRLKCVGKMMNTEKIVKEILSLPMYPELTSEQVTQVAGTIVSWYQNSVR